MEHGGGKDMHGHTPLPPLLGGFCQGLIVFGFRPFNFKHLKSELVTGFTTAATRTCKATFYLDWRGGYRYIDCKRNRHHENGTFFSAPFHVILDQFASVVHCL